MALPLLGLGALARFLPSAVRATAPYLGRGIAKVGRGFRKVQESPFIGSGLMVLSPPKPNFLAS